MDTKAKLQKLSFSKINAKANFDANVFLEKKKLISGCVGSIEKEALQILLLFHPVIVTDDYELLGGLNSFIEWQRFCSNRPLESKTKFNVVVVSSPLSEVNKERFRKCQNLHESLFIRKFIASDQKILLAAAQQIEMTRNFNNALVKDDGAVHKKNLSRELGQSNIRESRSD
jgi:hypothetical protein